MGGLSIWHWIIVGGVAFILFGGKFKISDVMGDVAKGIKAFKKGMAEDETAEAAKPVGERVEPRAIEANKSASGDKV
ncbi:twin-arginine translocase TatA/TatE family subunit [Methylocystis sp. MJC1]|jgi:sec-independent protein translocase protein TatA|uniref:twin-arginine translocase TatA/TatE family subunit n=1 Tax=Methylocystis sp. MJC1 TaxID=2654282 RepID=UPI0013EA8EF0|nr:twin-arginine translocase TatA/TatE family subunit [Methylocystis sp. MJC1]KAF2992835.1 Sec-independent protein translocase protein TatA [Methylocystis sp. MJC1]MBU6526794.1 twin-arginine translocase TatA/TatE family subunit [Methylocystis sp. MJC1]UZX13228.1 twin-arginine translocase TatA/TatE family subunit [Methylocystis sp. MJC1]